MTRPIPDPRPLRLMPREMRLMSERIFSLSTMPRGFALTLTDIPMLSQHLGFGGFALLHTEMALLLAADPRAIAVTAEDGPALTLDFAGQPAWVGLNAVLDLAAELVADHGRAEISVANAAHPAELAVAVALAPRTGLVLALDGTRLTAAPGPSGDPALEVLNREGTLLDPDLWWQIYETARSALAPDTAVSRRHAGVQIVNEDGTITGRDDSDDDADMAFLARGDRETA